VPATPDDAVHAHSIQEEYFYLMVHPCGCGGAWQSETQDTAPHPEGLRHSILARCARCGQPQTFHFLLDSSAGPKQPIRLVNPTPEPSRAIDAAEWMDLARFYLGRIPRLTKPMERAQSLLDARQCLEEALKFYGPGDDDPLPSALWSKKSRKKVGQQRDAFRRTSIAAMLEKIPPMDRLREADETEQREFKKALANLARARVGRWWQFWKRWKRT